MKKLKQYHHNWLDKHEKDVIWLRNALSNGFDIHHIDGDHSNNNPENLILIYCGDHARLHSTPIKVFSKRCQEKWMTEEERLLEINKIGGIVYALRKRNYTWKRIEILNKKSYPFLCKKLCQFCEINDLSTPKTKKKRKRKPLIKERRKMRMRLKINVYREKKKDSLKDSIYKKIFLMREESYFSWTRICQEFSLKQKQVKKYYNCYEKLRNSKIPL